MFWKFSVCVVASFCRFDRCEMNLVVYDKQEIVRTLYSSLLLFIIYASFKVLLVFRHASFVHF